MAAGAPTFAPLLIDVLTALVPPNSPPPLLHRLPALAPLLVDVLTAQAESQDATMQPEVPAGDEAAEHAASSSCPGWQVCACVGVGGERVVT